jgi:hypothetical protein
MNARFDPLDAQAPQLLAPSDWAPPLERLETETEVALERRQADPWALAEAECWLDLVHAEVVAAGTRGDLAAITRLDDWATRLRGLIARLSTLSSLGAPPWESRHAKAGDQ